MKRILVNVGLVVVLALIGWACFATGKAYKVILENVPYTADGKEYPAIEALQVTISKQPAPVYLLADDRMVGTAVGTSHVMLIELLDEEDKVTESKRVGFDILDLGDDLSINVVKAWNTGKV